MIAPLSANTLAKITGGFSDNLLTSVVRAWDTMGVLGDMNEALPQGKKLIVVALAMNTVSIEGECLSQSRRSCGFIPKSDPLRTKSYWIIY